jgi:chitodextrinase
MPALSEHEKALIRGIAEALNDEIRREIAKATAPLLARIAELESSSLKYLGVHQPSIAYRKGHVVTHDGAAWCATRDVSVERPGHSDGWQLMVKSAPPARSDTTTAAARQNGHYANPRAR